MSQFQLKFVRARWVTITTELSHNPRTAWSNWTHIDLWFGVLMGSWVLIAVYTGQSVGRDFDRECCNTSVWVLNQCAEITIQNVAVLWLNTVTDIITHEFGCEWFVILTSIEVHHITTVHTKGLASILSPFLQGHTDRSNTEPVHWLPWDVVYWTSTRSLRQVRHWIILSYCEGTQPINDWVE